MTRTALTLGVMVALAWLSLPARGAILIGTVGGGTGYDDTTPAFLSTDVAKTSDFDGDNAYGTAGRLMFGVSGGGSANGQPFSAHIDVLPSWVPSASAGADFHSVAYGYNHYTLIDHPALPPGPSVADWASRSGIALSTAAGTGFEVIADFTIGAGTPKNFRVGVMAGNEGTNNGRWDSSGIRLTGPDGSIATVTSLPITDPGLGWVFFDVDTGGATSGTFTILGQQRLSSQGPSIGGFTFDAAPADIVAGDVISIDFGPTAPVTANWNHFDYDGGGDTTVNNLMRLSDGADTGVEIEVTSIEGDTLAFLDGSAFGGSSDASIYADGIHSTGSGNDNLFITISGLDDSLEYNLFGGSLRGGADFGADWIIDGVTYSAPGSGNSFVSVNGVSTTSPGEILITITDPNNAGAPANNRNLGLAEFTITAAVPEPSTFAMLALGVLGVLLPRRRKR